MTAIETPREIHGEPFHSCGYCGRRHRSWHAVAKCRWDRAVWISGNPPPGGSCFAVASACHPGCTVTLLAAGVAVVTTGFTD